MHRASYRFMPFRGITETLSDVESVRAVHFEKVLLSEDMQEIAEFLSDRKE